MLRKQIFISSMAITLTEIETGTQYPLREIPPVSSATVTQTERNQGQERKKEGSSRLGNTGGGGWGEKALVDKWG